MSPECTLPAAFDKDNHDYSYFFTWCCKPFAFTAFRLTFLDGKTFDFAISDSKSSSYSPSLLQVTDESIPVMVENYCVSAPRGRKSRMRNLWDCPFKTVLTNCNCKLLLGLELYTWHKICGVKSVEFSGTSTTSTASLHLNCSYCSVE